MSERDNIIPFPEREAEPRSWQIVTQEFQDPLSGLTIRFKLSGDEPHLILLGKALSYGNREIHFSSDGVKVGGGTAVNTMLERDNVIDFQNGNNKRSSVEIKEAKPQKWTINTQEFYDPLSNLTFNFRHTPLDHTLEIYGEILPNGNIRFNFSNEDGLFTGADTQF